MIFKTKAKIVGPDFFVSSDIRFSRNTFDLLSLSRPPSLSLYYISEERIRTYSQFELHQVNLFF